MRTCPYINMRGLSPGPAVTLRVDRQIVTAYVAAAILGCTPYRVTRGIRDFSFRFAWDLRTPDDPAHRYRILTASLAAIQEAKPEMEPANYDAAEAMIVPDRPLRRTELLKILSINDHTYFEWREAGIFPKIQAGIGCQAKAQIPETLLKNFLRQRRVL